MRHFTDLLHLFHRLNLRNDWLSRWGSNHLGFLLRYQQDMEQSNHMEEEPVEEPKSCIAILLSSQPSNQKCHAELEDQREQYVYDDHEERPLSYPLSLHLVDILFSFTTSSIAATNHCYYISVLPVIHRLGQNDE